MEVRVERDPDPADIRRIEDEVWRETVAESGLPAEEDLVVLAREDGKVLGGCCGWTWGGTCEVSSLWVHPSYRRRGVAHDLLTAAEDEAAARECHQIVVLSHSFQAPGFYERHGYRTVGQVDDYPMGTSAIWFQKSLTRGA